MSNNARQNLLELAKKFIDYQWAAGEVAVLVEDTVFLIAGFDTVSMNIYRPAGRFGLGVGLMTHYRQPDGTWVMFDLDRLETEYQRWAAWARAWWTAKTGSERRRIEISAQSAERHRLQAAVNRGRNLPT